MTGAGSWSLGESDYQRISGHLTELLRESDARCAMVVDRTGQLLATVGEALSFDPTVFAPLTAADFSANDQLAKMIGEPEFASLFHQGQKESMYLADVGRRLILVVLFDQRTTVGLVRLASPTLTGYIADVTGSYTLPFLGLMAVALGGSAIAFWCPRPAR